MESFFAKVKIFRFWPKTMDYNKAFWPKSRSFFVVILLPSGRCYEAEICTILLLLRCPFRWNPFFTKVKMFRFWPKTMDYNKAFWPKSKSFFVAILLPNGRCYEAEICAILLLLRCPWFDCLESKKSVEKRISLERASQEEQNGANFSSVYSTFQ